ncbi:carbohydrate-binding module family 48 protein [Oidiodendron maius Zn]|uniref:Carbohydrate-binding module family 48 protein n=1 Tax=Oidiodendron maius (strain Zn) TaxID=913774 RepID=A0A0C3DWN6_OIDMZ|nr:carbohydrate-binding module family 48 protein [Oidiodendron maius Zn]
MGTFIFKWEHPASEVYVTGTFDDWSKSEKLVKMGDYFAKEVTLPRADEKIYYKFVVDGNWVTDHTAPQENDASGNLNNVLTTDRIVKPAAAATGVMAANGAPDVPGGFPETPAAVEKDAEENAFSVNPLPGAPGAVNPITLAPGEQVPHPSTFTPHTVTSGVHDDPELVAADQAKGESEPTFNVAPLPAFAGAVNPVQVAPGEALPHPSSVTANSLDSAVRLDKESYENSGALGHAPVLPPVVTPQSERDENGTGVLDLPPISNTMIPESSLPIAPAEAAAAQDAVPTIQSTGIESTTAQLAGAVPLESSKVPEVVKESQEEAGFSPEASAVPEEVKEKGEVEKELLSEVPEVPSTSEGTGGKESADKSEGGITAGEAAAAVGGAAVAVGGAAVAYAAAAADKLPESITSKLPESVQKSISDINAKSSVDTAAETTPAATETAAKDTPEVVKESIAASGEGPEAAANEDAVLEKKEVEKELLSEVKLETSTGEPAPTTTTAPAQSREVSPGTVPGDHAVTAAAAPEPALESAPAAATGATSTTTETTSAAPSKPATGNGTADAEEKRKKRTSFFGKLKARFSDKK